MGESSIDLSGLDEPQLRAIAQVVESLRSYAPDYVPLLFGAMARDVFVRHVGGRDIVRATTDIDFAIAVDDWDDYFRFRRLLIGSGEFHDDPRSHQRVRHGTANSLDLVPFGGVEDGQGEYTWPSGHETMSALGCREAAESSIDVRLPGGQQLAVVSLPALVILKLIAWRDRPEGERAKHAQDVCLVVSTYMEIDNGDRLFNEARHLLDHDRFDYAEAGAWLAGRDARDVCHTDSGRTTLTRTVMEILDLETRPDGPLYLVAEMNSRDATTALALLMAFAAGLKGHAHPWA